MDFFEVLFSLVRLSLEVKDDFLKEKLVKKTKDFFSTYNSVAQVNLFNKVDGLNEFIEVLIYLKLVELSPALLAQKNLLVLETELISSVSLRAKKGKTKARKEEIKDTSFEQRIVDYLKTKSDGVQTNEIAKYFKAHLSRRTVQRYLKELITAGLVKKEKVAGFPRYLAT